LVWRAAGRRWQLAAAGTVKSGAGGLARCRGAVPLLWATKIDGDVPRCTRRPLLRSTASKLGRRAHAGEDGDGPGNTLQYGGAMRGASFDVS
jgi:hypothetical protein